MMGIKAPTCTKYKHNEDEDIKRDVRSYKILEMWLGLK